MSRFDEIDTTMDHIANVLEEKDPLTPRVHEVVDPAIAVGNAIILLNGRSPGEMDPQATLLKAAAAAGIVLTRDTATAAQLTAEDITEKGNL